MIQTYYRILEAFKYAFATRTRLGDVDFLDLQEVCSVVVLQFLLISINDALKA